MSENTTKPTIEKSITKRPSLKINAISNWGPLIVNTFIGLWLTPYLIGNLGMAKYGIWALVGSFLGYYGLLRLGVGSGLMRYVPFYKGSNDPNAVSHVVSTGVAMSLLAGLVILLISVLLAEPITRFYQAGPELASLIRILGVAATLECPMRIIDACIRSQEYWVAANLVSIATAICRALGLAGCVYMGYGIVEMGYVVLGVTILSAVLAGIVFVRYCSDIRIRLSMVRISHAQALVSFGILTTIIGLVYTLTLQGHSFIIGKLISLEAVAIYAVPALIIRNVRQGLLAPARVLWPRFAYLDGKNDSDEIASLFFRGTRLTAVFSSGVLLIVFVFGPCFIRLWVGADFKAAYPVLLLLAGGYLVDGSQAILPFLMGGTGRQGLQAKFATAEAVIGISLSILLTWRLGLVGTATGFVIAIVLIRGLICPWYVCRLLNIRTIKYYINCLLRPWLVLATLTLIAGYIGVVKFVDNWPRLILAAVMTGIVYTICAYYIAMIDEEKELIKSYVRKLSVRVLIQAGIKE